ncbi:MAG: DegV family protein [Halanaerobiales bacterium]|nr:DegV family protein [Halanaerobiales bacterium]
MMFKIVADSSCDTNKDLMERLHINKVPLTIQIDDESFKDDEKLDIKNFLNKIKESKDLIKTASPSPHDFMKKFAGMESVFVVTLSSKLSGTYNSAILAKNMFLDTVGHKFIHVFDSLSASVGETLVSLKISELGNKNLDPLIIVDKVKSYIKELKTYFVLESLDTLIKAGRISAFKGKIASMLSIKPIMRANDGAIELVENIRSSKKALKRLIEVIGEKGEKLDEKILGIAHCNCLEKAEKFKEEVLKRYNFKDIIIVETAALSSVYANEGGIIIAF